MVRKAPPTAMSHPVRGSARAQATGDEDADARHEREPEQPACLPAERRVEQAQRPGRSAEHVAAGASRACRPALPRGRGRCIRRSATRRVVRAVPEIQGLSAAGVSSTSAGHAPPTMNIAAPPASSARRACSRPRAAGATHSHAAAIAGTTTRATPIFVSKPSPTADTREHQPARAPLLERPHRAPQGRHAAQHQQRVGVVVTRDRDGHRREREDEAADEAADPPEAPAHQVIERGPRSRRPSAPAAPARSASGSRRP